MEINQEPEIYKPIKDYDNYSISNLGNVKNNTNNKLLKIQKSSRYSTIGLNHNSKTNAFLIHRLVAQAYIPNPENKEQVNHIDGNKANNLLCNLEWMTQSENIQHSFDIGLRPISEAVRESGRIAARDFGAKNGAIIGHSIRICVRRYGEAVRYGDIKANSFLW